MKIPCKRALCKLIGSS